MKRVSEKQLIANRENAQLGGVKTVEGKAVTRHNALKHGLLSREVLLASENEFDLAALRQGLQLELAPGSPFEQILADCVIANTWRLRRVLRIEREIMESRPYGMPEPTEGTLGANFAQSHAYLKLQRYEANIERSLYRALHELQRLQAVRRGETVIAPIVVDMDVSGGKDGFVS